MYILTNRQMREADEYTIKTLGVPSLLLMERAGNALADEAERLSPQGKICCVCGGGNNGGDGFVCARILKSRGREVECVFYAQKISVDCRVNMEKWTVAGGGILSKLPKNCDLIVDCLYGTGFHGGVFDTDMGTMDEINSLKKQGVKVLSADIPSGVNGENGKVETIAVEADTTLCIGEIKTGVLFGDGIDYAGEIKRADIGIQLMANETYALLSDRENVNAILPKRKRNSHKGTFGRAAIVAGSVEYTGAAYLAASACLRSGAGYTTLFTPSEILPHYFLKVPEILLKSTNDGGRYAFNEERIRELLAYDSIAYGMGMGVSEDVAKGAEWLLEHYEGKLVLDADGLNSLARYKKETLSVLFKNKKCDVLLTPHSKEFSYLCGISVKEVLEGGMSAAKALAEAWNVGVLLKNAVSVITDGRKTAINASGNSGQAKGGSGDALSGVIAGLCAMGLPCFDAGVAGAYLLGKSAEFAAKDLGEYSLTATELIAYLPMAFLFVTKNSYEESGEQ